MIMKEYEQGATDGTCLEKLLERACQSQDSQAGSYMQDIPEDGIV